VLILYDSKRYNKNSSALKVIILSNPLYLGITTRNRSALLPIRKASILIVKILLVLLIPSKTKLGSIIL
jgi:hypothetical protein